jgi:hypothetical protein
LHGGLQVRVLSELTRPHSSAFVIQGAFRRFLVRACLSRGCHDPPTPPHSVQLSELHACPPLLQGFHCRGDGGHVPVVAALRVRRCPPHPCISTLTSVRAGCCVRARVPMRFVSVCLCVVCACVSVRVVCVFVGSQARRKANRRRMHFKRAILRYQSQAINEVRSLWAAGVSSRWRVLPSGAAVCRFCTLLSCGTGAGGPSEAVRERCHVGCEAHDGESVPTAGVFVRFLQLASAFLYARPMLRSLLLVAAGCCCCAPRVWSIPPLLLSMAWTVGGSVPGPPPTHGAAAVF